MPDYKDLKDIKDKIQNIGDEKNILDEKGMPITDSPIPSEEEIISDEEKNIDKEENLLGDILEDFEKGHVIKEEESQEKAGTPLNEEQYGFEDVSEEIETGKEKKESEDFSDKLIEKEIQDLEDFELKDEGLEALLGKGFEEEIPSEKEGKAEGIKDMGLTFEEEAELEDFEKMQQKEKGETEGIKDFGEFIEEERPKEDIAAVGDEELEALLKDSYEEQKELEEEPSIKIEEEPSSEEILDKLGKEEVETKFEELPDLESLLGEKEVERDVSKGKGEVKKEVELEEEIEMPDFIAGKDKELEDLEEIIGEKEKEVKPEVSEKLEFEGKEEIFDLGEIGAEEIPSIESREVESELKDLTFGEIPDEISKEDLKADQDIELKLTEDERKKIIISLTSLPKEAEIKISKAIISNKYSNAKLKPLINALIYKESPHVIIKYYEKITQDKSLSGIEAVKYTGVKFEERKKTISYVFEKNILPLIAKVSVVIAIIGLFLLLVFGVIKPTLEASNLYKEGRKLIDDKNYLEGEKKFQEAFNKQPRFREVVKYARKYREHKRYLATEEKYELAKTMKPDNNDIALEYSDFLREKKDFERAEVMYKNLIKTDRNKLSATLGLAKTYFNWAEEEAGKLEDAKEAYKDALEIDKNNKEAIFGNLNIYIKQKNQEGIINHYNYIERKFKRRVDPLAYSNLAEYFINIGELNEAKNVLDRASSSIKTNEYIPEIEYQFARYKKNLSVYNEEKTHLNKAISLFEKMKKGDPIKYESDKYKRLLSTVYNDLGENTETFTQASPEAEKYYIKAIEIDKNYGKTYYNLANFALKYKPDGYREAKDYYLKAEKNGFVNDNLNYNLGWLYFKEGNYYDSYNRISRIIEKQPENSNLKFMIGTIFYKLGKYELSESILLENYIHFMDLSEMYYPLELSEKEDRMIMEMLKKISNNLGAAYQKRFEETKNSKYLIKASKYYADSIIYFDKLENIYESEVDIYSTEKRSNGEQTRDKKGNANINFRMVLYPYAGIEEPILYEDFPLDFTIYM